MSTPWIVVPPSNAPVTSRLLCFPFAGGATQAYRGFAAHVPEGMQVAPVLLPGRWTRLREPPFTDMRLLLDALWQGTAALLDVPVYLFGHSLGGLLAFEYARMMRTRLQRLPVSMIISGRRAPDSVVAPGSTRLSTLSDSDFVKTISERYQGIQPEILANAELLSLVLPALRADMTMYEDYRYREEPALDCRLSVWRGLNDPNVASADLPGWQAHSAHPIRTEEFAGGHFFIQPDRDEIFTALRRGLLL